jgi:glycosyltransferase involved in cell wall biosynthesis
MKTITIIVPSYNEEKNIRPFYDETTPFLNHPDFVYEILYVNDGSKDGTLQEIKKLAKEDRRVRYLSFSRNFGKEAAMHAGLEASQDKDCVVIIDCDLQQPPSLIPKMIEHYLEGYKIVYTKGATRKGEPKMRTFFANLYYRIYNKYTDTPLDNGAKDYQLLDKDVVKAFLSLGDKYRFVKGIFSWVGFKRKCLEYDFIPRRYGKSTWSFKSLFRYGFNGMNQFSQIMMILPLLAFLAGIVLLGTAVALYAFSVFTLGEFLLSLQATVVLFVVTGLAYGMYYLVYGLRKQVLNRPIYLIEEASDIDE